MKLNPNPRLPAMLSFQALPSRTQKWLKTAAWASYAVLVFLVALRWQIPHTHLETILSKQLHAQLNQAGIGLKSDPPRLRFFPQIQYRIPQPVFRSQGKQLALESLTVTPSLWRLLLGGSLAVSFQATHQSTTPATPPALAVAATSMSSASPAAASPPATASPQATTASTKISTASTPLPTTPPLLKLAPGRLSGWLSASKSESRVSLSLEQWDLAQADVFNFFLNVKAAGVLQGQLSWQGNPQDLSHAAASLNCKISGLGLGAQTLAGFQVPRLSFGDGQLELELKAGKALLKSARLGINSVTSDLDGTLTGELSLNKNVNLSSLDLKTKFNLSKNLLTAVPLLEALLQNGKSASGGEYAFALTGTLAAPLFAPLKQ